jgi:hypothetical protein
MPILHPGITCWSTIARMLPDRILPSLKTIALSIQLPAHSAQPLKIGMQILCPTLLPIYYCSSSQTWIVAQVVVGARGLELVVTSSSNLGGTSFYCCWSVIWQSSCRVMTSVRGYTGAVRVIDLVDTEISSASQPTFENHRGFVFRLHSQLQIREANR